MRRAAGPLAERNQFRQTVGVGVSLARSPEPLGECTKLTSIVRALAALVLLGCVGGAQAQSAAPFIMVVNSDAGTDGNYFTVLNTYAQAGDYFGYRLVTYDQTLAAIVGYGNTFASPPSLKNVAARAQVACTEYAPTSIVYEAADADTPAPELGALAGSIKTAARTVATGSGGCHLFAVSIGPDYLGINVAKCSYNPSSIFANQYNNYSGSNIFESQFDWTGVSVIVLQTQQLMNDGSSSKPGTVTCASPSKIAYVLNFVDAVSDMVARLRVAAPQAKIVAQLSFRYTNPQAMIQAMAGVTGTGGVDGFYLAYPIGSAYPCSYCNSADLQAVLSALRPKS
jgi:hypothetical protein